MSPVVCCVMTDSCKPLFQKWFQRQTFGVHTARQWSPNTRKEINSLPIDCPRVSYLVWNKSFSRAVNDVFKKKKESGRFPDKFCTAQFPSRCHARTKHCIVFSGSSAHVHLNLFVSSYDLLIPARIRKGRHTCSTSEAPCIGPTVYFI